MSETVNFIQGSKNNYDSSTMQGGVYFSKDSKEILLNGESYGNAVPADEEDITATNGSLKLKDREVDVANFQSRGYKILRKNIVDGKNILTQNMINEPNTIYEIRYDFDLNDEKITVPDNCYFVFKCGSVANGSLIFSNYFSIEFSLFSGEIQYSSQQCYINTIYDFNLKLNDNVTYKLIIEGKGNTIQCSGKNSISCYFKNLCITKEIGQLFTFTCRDTEIIHNIVFEDCVLEFEDEDTMSNDMELGFGSPASNVIGNFKRCILKNVAVNGIVKVQDCKSIVGNNHLNNHEQFHIGKGSRIINTDFDGNNLYINTDAIDVYNASNIVIEGCTFHDYKLTTDTEQNIYNNLITIKSHYNNGNPQDSDIIGQQQGIIISNCVFQDIKTSVFFVWNGLRNSSDVVDDTLNRVNTILKGNTFYNCNIGLILFNISNVLFTCNSLYNTNGVWMRGSTKDIILSNNSIENSSSNSKFFIHCNNDSFSDILVSSNVFESNGYFIQSLGEGNINFTISDNVNNGKAVLLRDIENTDTSLELFNNVGFSDIKLSGTTNSRPTLPSTFSGFMFYDTTLLKSIIWNGTEWVNVDGTSLENWTTIE